MNVAQLKLREGVKVEGGNRGFPRLNERGSIEAFYWCDPCYAKVSFHV